MKQKIECYIGISGSGKTTKILHLAKEFQENGKKIGGIATIGNFKNGKRHSFWVVDLSYLPNQKILLAERHKKSNVTIGCFGFTMNGLKCGNEWIADAFVKNVDVLIVDEIGPLELSDKGWAESLTLCTQSNVPHIIFTSRPTTVVAIQNKFFPNRNIEIIEM